MKAQKNLVYKYFVFFKKSSMTFILKDISQTKKIVGVGEMFIEELHFYDNIYILNSAKTTILLMMAPQKPKSFK